MAEIRVIGQRELEPQEIDILARLPKQSEGQIRTSRDLIPDRAGQPILI